MRKWLVLAAVVAAVSASQAFGRPGSNGGVVKIPLPAAGQASIETFTVTVKGHGPGHLVVKDVNDRQFGNASSVVVVRAPTKPSANTKYVVSFLTRRFPSADRVPASASATIDVQISIKFASGNTGTVNLGSPRTTTDCTLITGLDKFFERSSTINTNAGDTFTLESIRPQSAQDSPPEEVLDNVVALVWPTQKCPGQPEGDDAGSH